MDGNGQYAHLLSIHDCESLVVKNLIFRNGNTNLIRHLSKKDIHFRSSQMSIFEIIDGAGALITGNSTVKFENCRFENNKSLMCGGAISNQSFGKVSLQNCVFENNKAGHTGSAVDNLVNNSQLKVEDCSFFNNQSNLWNKSMAPHGQISVFPSTYAEIINSTFKGGSIPVDYEVDSNIKLENNKYIGFEDWQDMLKKRHKSTLLDSIKLLGKVYWLLPKTMGKVYYRVNG